jgi:predicted lipid-binding transport protein (Tim44 family)
MNAPARPSRKADAIPISCGMKIPQLRRTLPLLLTMLLVLAPSMVEARVNSGLSLGSRGSHTYATAPGTSNAPYGSAPVQSSMTPRSYGGYGTPGYGGYGMSGRSAFASGLLGGLVGAGIGGMLFGHGFFGGMHGGMGFLGLLLQLFLLYMLASWLYRRFFAGNLAPAGADMFARRFNPAFGNSGAGARPGFAPPRPANRPLALAPPDYQSFDRLLHNIQAAWSVHDLNALRGMATPEMVSYFADQMAEQTSRGVRNQVSGVQLLQGDLSEAWSERSREYATVSMRFSMLDVTRDRAGHVVDGSLTERVTVTEFWTFVRTPGGQWVLSAIQQPR